MRKTSKTNPIQPDSSVRQFQFGMGLHDGTQYNFFAGDKVFSVRLIESYDVSHQSAWYYDGEIHEITLENRPLAKRRENHVDVSTENFSLKADDDGGSLIAGAETAKACRVTFTSPLTYCWGTPGEAAVIHQPLLDASIDYCGHTLKAVGYCKRFWFRHQTDYLAWRFIEGELDSGNTMLWTADGNFGGDYQKYDYFKIVTRTGKLKQADDTGSYHRDDSAYAEIDGIKHTATIEPLGTWSCVLRGKDTNLKLRQRFCRLTLNYANITMTGFAINETGVGAIR